jgi:hypothetical protein
MSTVKFAVSYGNKKKTFIGFIMKIGRNQPCPCKSGLKYKKCCGNPLSAENVHKFSSPLSSLPPEILRAIEQHEADELIRKGQQGLGKPIIGAKIKNQQIVAVGNTIHSSPNWITFPDFLSYYIKVTLGSAWGEAETEKPFDQRHPIMQWHEEYCRFQQRGLIESGEIKSAVMTGIVYCYLGLAYSLYLLDHNVELQTLLIKRLKDSNNFQGAYYELIIANCLIRAGFDLVLEDETDRSSKHCEFAAISTITGKKYWVEAKMKAVLGILGKTANGATKVDPTSELIPHLNQALKKPATDERLIFIDLNAESDKQDPPLWVERAVKKLEKREQTITTDEKAYVFVTNMCFHRSLTEERPGHSMLAHGLGIDDFGKPGSYRLSEIYRLEQKHADAHNIMKAFQTYPQLPATFDGSLPSVAFSRESERLVIGETYLFNNLNQQEGIIGTVTTACVLEEEKTIYFIIKTANKNSLIMTKPMSEQEYNDYQAHKEGFFGSLKHRPTKKDDPYEHFKFFVESYQNCTKDQLLALMKDASDIKVLSTMNLNDLLLEYCERLVASAIKK